MITADPRTYIGHICAQVDKMKAGERLDVSIHDLRRNIQSFEHNGAIFTPADRVLENIVGSAYTVSYLVNLDRGTVTFEKHEDTGKRHYQSPDRRFS